jgi:predicted ABC-type sugar transport system permease subunit
MSGMLHVRHAPDPGRISEPSEPNGGFTTPTELPPYERDVSSMFGRLRSVFSSQSMALFIVLVALTVFFSVLRPDAFPNVANVMNMATNASILLVLAVGSTFVILTGGGVIRLFVR